MLFLNFAALKGPEAYAGEADVPGRDRAQGHWKDVGWEGAENRVHMCVHVSGLLLPKHGYEKS